MAEHRASVATHMYVHNALSYRLRDMHMALSPVGRAGVHLTKDHAVVVADGRARWVRGCPSDIFAAAGRSAEVVLDIGAMLCPYPVEHLPGLGRVTTIRVSPRERSIRAPMFGWPEALRERVDGGNVHMVGGIDLYGGRPVAPNPACLDHAVRLADQRGAGAFAVAAAGSLLDRADEYQVADYLAQHGGGRPVHLSHAMGGISFLEREAATILNAAFQPRAATLLDRIEEATPTRVRTSFLLADGSCVGREELRAAPLRAVGTYDAAVAQGAARRYDSPQAVVVLLDGDRTRIATVHDGCLRADSLRRLSDWIPDGAVAQRHASIWKIDRESAAELLASMGRGDRQPIGVVCRPDERDFGLTITARMPSLVLVEDRPELLAAVGAAYAEAQSEVVVLANAETQEDLSRVRQEVRTTASTRILATSPEMIPRTVSDHYVPLSFLKFGPAMFHVHMAAGMERY